MFLVVCGRSAQPRQIVRSIDDLDPSYISADFLLVYFVAAEFTELSLLSVVVRGGRCQQSHLPRASSSRMPPGVMRLPAGLTGCGKYERMMFLVEPVSGLWVTSVYSQLSS